MREKLGVKTKGKVQCVWSSAIAYATGLITADGNLSKDGRHIIFVAKDLQQINNFLSSLEIPDNRIGKKVSGYGTNAWYTQFSDRLFWQWLITIGLRPNKSKVLGALQIPQRFFFDFLRGFFDGDGSVYGFRDNRWPQSYMFYVSFTSASPKFLQWLQWSIRQQLGTTGHITKGNRAFQLKYAKKDGLAILRAMYYSPDLPCLGRKRHRALKLLMTAARFTSADVVQLVDTLA